MQKDRHRRAHPLLLVAMALLVAAVFASELFVPLGIAVWVFYLAPLGLCLYTWRPSLPLFVALAATALMIVALAIPRPEDLAPRISAVNRTIGVLTIWFTAVVVRQFVILRTEVDRQDWVKRAQMAVAEAIRGEPVQGEIGRNVLGLFAGLLEAQVGAFYARESDALERVATWAHAATPATGQRLLPGEGLLGQAVLERRVIAVRDVPPSYLRVGSALGEAPPREILVVPTTAGGDVNGAYELGFLTPTDASTRELLELTAEPIGIALKTAAGKAQLVALLEKTRHQAEELQRQHESLRVANEELEEQGRILRESQARLETQQSELEMTNVELEAQSQALEQQTQELTVTQKALALNAQELERASRYKSEFLANMSHELRTPLNSLLILAKLLGDNATGNLDEDQVQYARTIYSAGNDLLALINDILDVSKIEAGKLEVQREVVPLARVVEELTRTFRPVATERKLALEVLVETGSPATLMTDSQRLQQILKNLLSNALKFTEKGGVTLSAGPAGAGRIRFTVTDTGVGIAREQQAHLFEPFRQADGTTSRRYGGTGLGLSISRQLARLLGGDVSFESEPGRGSAFTLEIPSVYAPPPEAPLAVPAAAKAPEAPPAPAARPPVPRASAGIDDDREKRARGERLILIVEDDVPFAQILLDLAHERDFDGVVATGSQEGLELARALRPAAIVLDVGLPDESGLVLLDRLKRDPALRHVPVHIVSMSDHSRTALELGAIGYALKPVMREEMLAALAKLEAKLQQRIRRVLVVEDDGKLRESIGALLRSDGVEITGVGTVRETLERLAATTFDCMIMDLVLPDGSGYDLLERMSEKATAFPPVIVYTGRALTHDEEQALRRYSRSIIIKGARSPERLLDEVTLFLHQIESDLPPEQQRILKAVRHREAIFEDRRILIVEDDVRNIFALSRVLEQKGCKLEIARNGREALAALERVREIDLVLMDVMMPEMDGITAMREIRKRPDLGQLPIIAVTAKAMKDDQEQCLGAGANDYIAKPIDVDKLLSLCRVWMPK
jgi:signal transduction histidine kinase/DNA-binding response OmpR family regulator